MRLQILHVLLRKVPRTVREPAVGIVKLIMRLDISTLPALADFRRQNVPAHVRKLRTERAELERRPIIKTLREFVHIRSLLIQLILVRFRVFMSALRTDQTRSAGNGIM